MISLTKPTIAFIHFPSKPKTQQFHTIFNTHHEPFPRRIHLQNPIKKPPQTTISDVGSYEMWGLCGFGNFVQGFRCFPWLALNYHLVQSLSLSPSRLQMVHLFSNLPLGVKAGFGVISDSVYIGGAHRLPYISIGVFLQAISWGSLALLPIVGRSFALHVVCIFFSNLGASIGEVAIDALVAEFSRLMGRELQSYGFTASSVGYLFGNLLGGFVLLATREPKIMFFIFACLLSAKLAFSLVIKEKSLKLSQHSSPQPTPSSVSENLKKQYSDLIVVLSNKRMKAPLIWIVGSVSVVPLLTGSHFVFQTQFLKIDPSIIGLSKVVGQVVVLSATFIYQRYLKGASFRKLIIGIQILYALTLLSDLFLVKQINIKMGISNKVHVLLFSALSESVAQFKILPFNVLFSNMCPKGCEGSLVSFVSSVLCLASIVNGLLGIVLATVFHITAVDYTLLPYAICVQFITAFIPLKWISSLPVHNVEDRIVS